MKTNLPVTELKGVGQKKSEVLEQLKISTIDDLLHHYPREYERYLPITSIKELKINEINVIEGTICEQTANVRKKHLVITKTKIRDHTGTVNIVWYGQPYLKNKFRIGDKFVFRGKAEIKYNMLQMQSPQIFTVEDYNIKLNELQPTYPLTKNLTQKSLEKIINLAIQSTYNQLKEYLPDYIRKQYNLVEYNYSIRQIHNPDSFEAMEKARQRLVFDEFLLFQLGLALIKQHVKISKNNFKFRNIDKEKEFLDALPYNLTNAQQKVWKEIKENLTSEHTMNRLVQGDVGSGKTVIAALALLYAAENNYQSCLMAPTEVLAKQHYYSITELLNPLSIEVGLLVGSMTKKEKEFVYNRLKKGELDILIGTHAIIQEKVEFNNLALAITDEQHRFGVNQREVLSSKGLSPHILVMSATPIPRTLALIVYGDMDVSIIDELPPGRKEVDTYTVNSSYRPRIYSFMENEIEKGRQIYVICPMVEESEEMELESVISYTDKLKESFPNNIIIEYLHGRMKAKEKNDIMERFAEGKINILVSTTVIEVGVNVPNASVMVIENAERFGLAQLHQLRGRVGRGEYQSYCILLTDSKNEITKKRMKVMCDSTDGFVISEFDLKLRGPGDVFGIKQHGLPEFKLGNIFEDMDVLKETNNLARKIIEKDPKLEIEDFKYLNDKITNYFKRNIDNISL